MSVDTLAAEAIAIWGDAKRPPEHRPWVGNAVDVILKEALLGQSLDLNLPEMGAEGPAEVIAIASCPPLESANEPGRRLVTSVFRHTSNDVVDLQLQGPDTPIGTTSNHPFWSVDREAFIPAGDLRIGERLKQADGLYTHVTRVTPRPRLATSVYNLEVDGQHVYHVGIAGLLVHNSCISSHGYGIINRDTGEIYKIGISRRGFNTSGRSIRAQEQLTTIATNNGVPRELLESVVLRRFGTSTDLFRWENETVGFLRQLGHLLPDNIRPAGLPF